MDNSTSDKTRSAHVHEWNEHSAKYVNTTNEMVDDLIFKNPCELSKISENIEKPEQNSTRKAMIIHINNH